MFISRNLIVTTEKTIANDLLEFSFNDADFNGENGNEFTSDKANELGISDLKLAIKLASEQTKSLVGLNKIETFIEEFINHWEFTSSNYYSNIEFDIAEIPNSNYYAISIVALAEN